MEESHNPYAAPNAPAMPELPQHPPNVPGIFGRDQRCLHELMAGTIVIVA